MKNIDIDVYVVKISDEFFSVSPHMISTFFFSFFFISRRLITLQYCGGFCHTLT